MPVPVSVPPPAPSDIWPFDLLDPSDLAVFRARQGFGQEPDTPQRLEQVRHLHEQAAWLLVEDFLNRHPEVIEVMVAVDDFRGSDADMTVSALMEDSADTEFVEDLFPEESPSLEEALNGLQIRRDLMEQLGWVSLTRDNIQERAVEWLGEGWRLARLERVADQLAAALPEPGGVPRRRM